MAEDGSSYACDVARSVDILNTCNLQETSYENLITSTEAKILRTLAPENMPVCESCPFGPFCGYRVVRGLNQHGNFMPKIAMDFECKTTKKIVPYLFKKLMTREDALILNQWVDY